MTDRYVATTAAGERAITTNSRSEAEQWAARMNGEVIDTEQSA